MALDDVARRLDAASDTLTGAHRILDQTGPGARAFGGDAPGQLGELGRQLHAAWAAAVGARQREAAAQATRLAEIADAVRLAVRGYRGTEEDLSRQQDPGGR